MEHNYDGERVYIGISAENWKQDILSPIHDLETQSLYLNIYGTSGAHASNSGK